jgi:hypothetical protein
MPRRKGSVAADRAAARWPGGAPGGTTRAAACAESTARAVLNRVGQAQPIALRGRQSGPQKILVQSDGDLLFLLLPVGSWPCSTPLFRTNRLVVFRHRSFATPLNKRNLRGLLCLQVTPTQNIHFHDNVVENCRSQVPRGEQDGGELRFGCDAREVMCSVSTLRARFARSIRHDFVMPIVKRLGPHRSYEGQETPAARWGSPPSSRRSTPARACRLS